MPSVSGNLKTKNLSLQNNTGGVDYSMSVSVNDEFELKRGSEILLSVSPDDESVLGNVSNEVTKLTIMKDTVCEGNVHIKGKLSSSDSIIDKEALKQLLTDKCNSFLASNENPVSGALRGFDIEVGNTEEVLFKKGFGKYLFEDGEERVVTGNEVISIASAGKLINGMMAMKAIEGGYIDIATKCKDVLTYEAYGIPNTQSEVDAKNRYALDIDATAEVKDSDGTVTTPAVGAVKRSPFDRNDENGVSRRFCFETVTFEEMAKMNNVEKECNDNGYYNTMNEIVDSLNNTTKSWKDAAIDAVHMEGLTMEEQNKSLEITSMDNADKLAFDVPGKVYTKIVPVDRELTFRDCINERTGYPYNDFGKDVPYQAGYFHLARNNGHPDWMGVGTDNKNTKDTKNDLGIMKNSNRVYSNTLLEYTANMNKCVLACCQPGYLSYGSAGTGMSAAMIIIAYNNIERASLRPNDLMKMWVTEPLGMTKTGYLGLKNADGTVRDDVLIAEGGQPIVDLIYKKDPRLVAPLASPYHKYTFEQPGAFLASNTADLSKLYRSIIRNGLNDDGVKVFSESTCKHLRNMTPDDVRTAGRWDASSIWSGIALSRNNKADFRFGCQRKVTSEPRHDTKGAYFDDVLSWGGIWGYRWSINFSENWYFVMNTSVYHGYKPHRVGEFYNQLVGAFQEFTKQ